nr:hypothetical protein [Bacillus sonorensis]
MTAFIFHKSGSGFSINLILISASLISPFCESSTIQENVLMTTLVKRGDTSKM